MPIKIPQYSDPAFDPNRAIAGSTALGSIATGSDAFATELSKLGNGMFNTLATSVGAENAAKLFSNNVKITADFQDHLEQAHPAAAKIGKWASLGDIGILTAPIFGNSLPASLASGVGGALVSAAGDQGSNPGKAPDLKEALGTGGVLGAIGGVASRGMLKGLASLGASQSTGNALARGVLQLGRLGSRGVEGSIEGISPDMLKNNQGE